MKIIKVASLFVASTLMYLLIIFWDGANLSREIYGLDLDSLFQLMFLYLASFAIIYFCLMFFTNTEKQKWWKFARVYLPISAVLIFLSDGGGTGGLFVSGLGGGFDREGMVWFTSGLFLVASLVVIGRAWWKNRKTVFNLPN
jgi:hypothetical protein